MLCSLGIYANIEIFKSYRRFFYERKEDALRDLEKRMNREYILRNLKENGGEVFLDVETDEVLIWYKKDDSSLLKWSESFQF